MAKRKSRLDSAAEGIGSALGTALNQVEAQVKSAKAQRQSAIKSLVAVRDRANRMLVDLGHSVASLPVPGMKRRGRPPKQVGSAVPPAVKATGDGTKKRKGGLSEAGRRAIAAAQKARWAAIRAAKKSGKG